MLDDDREWHIKPPKSYSGFRTLPLPSFVSQRLAAARQASELPQVVQQHPNMLTGQFEALLRKLFGSVRFRFHDLRHYNASVMLAQGVPNKYAQERLGHATDNMLKAVYQHTFLSKQKEISDGLNNYFDSLMQHEKQHESDQP